MDYNDYLTKEEQQAIYKENADCGWGFTKEQTLAYIETFRNGTDKDKASVLCRFEDVNYHTIGNLLEQGMISAAIAKVNEDFQ